MATLPCPYLLPNGQRCPGHILKIEASNADLSWIFMRAVSGHSITRSRARSTASSAPKKAIIRGIVGQSR